LIVLIIFVDKLSKMSIYNTLAERSESKCEMCGSSESIKEIAITPRNDDSADHMIVACEKCQTEIEDPSLIDVNHWRCLNDSAWSAVPAVQVVAYRMLSKMPQESWAEDLLGMMYMEDETREWAEQGMSDSSIVHKDSNGNVLQAGDTVTLIKDLVVKGANFTAKRGTAVRRISLVHDNANHIEGKVDGQHIVILTQYVKKN